MKLFHGKVPFKPVETHFFTLVSPKLWYTRQWIHRSVDLIPLMFLVLLRTEQLINKNNFTWIETHFSSRFLFVFIHLIDWMKLGDSGRMCLKWFDPHFERNNSLLDLEVSIFRGVPRSLEQLPKPSLSDFISHNWISHQIPRIVDHNRVSPVIF